MEKYNVKNHLFYDGYDLEEEKLADVSFITDFMDSVNNSIFNNEGTITIIPYFNGKVREDGGVSGVILGNNFHFTCHAFCYKHTVFIDYFGDDDKKDSLLNMILNTFKTNNYDLGSKDKEGNFGKHIIIERESITFDEAVNMINKILNGIEMNPISKLLIEKKDNVSFDILQPIAESHISLHQNNDKLVIDTFSCKYFDTDKLMSIVGESKGMIEVKRGIQYK